MNRKGIIGILALFLMFSLVLFGSAISLITKSHYKNMVNRADGVKSLYLAEAGIERAIWALKNDSILQDTGILYSEESLGEGFYTVEIKGIDIVDGDTKIILESTGFLGSSTQKRGRRRILEEILFHNPDPIDTFTKYVLFWGNTDGGGSLALNNSVDVSRIPPASGDVFANGDISINHSSRVSPGLVYSTGTVSGGGVYTPGGVPDPIPAFPQLDTSYYDDKINIAGTQPPGDWTLSGGTYNLGGGTLYVNGNVTIRNTAHVIGPGTIVATGDITIRNATASSNVEFVAGCRLEVENSAQLTGNNRLYSSEEIKIKNSSVVEGEVITLKDIEIENSTVIRGIIYAGGETELKNSVQILGSIISNEFKDSEITNAVHIVHDETYIPSTSPPGLTESGEPEARVLSYKELPY